MPDRLYYFYSVQIYIRLGMNVRVETRGQLAVVSSPDQPCRAQAV